MQLEVAMNYFFPLICNIVLLQGHCKMSKIEIKNIYKIFGNKPQSIMQMVKDGATKEDILDEDQQEELYDYFLEAETDSIEAALEEFDGDYDEEELKLYRIKFLSEVAN